jgi:hypothetical protein
LQWDGPSFDELLKTATLKESVYPLSYAIWPGNALEELKFISTP